MALRPEVGANGAAARGELSAFALDVQYYLSLEPKQLPSRYFYDALGSRLFDAICELPWYPVTRAELRLLATRGAEIWSLADPVSRIVELGCGNGSKLATLLHDRRWTSGIDVHLIDGSATALAESARTLRALDGVRVHLHEASYEVGLAHVAATGPQDRTLVLFLGSNLGNFDPPSDEAFLREVRAALAPGDLLLLGADLTKPESVLALAYDDPLGVTAAFNRNLLVRINRELGGDFDLSAFAHQARWNAAASRVEMHLVALRRQSVHVSGAATTISLEAGESIWTESSYKYEPAGIAALLARAGFRADARWIDEADRFALTLARPDPST